MTGVGLGASLYGFAGLVAAQAEPSAPPEPQPQRVIEVFRAAFDAPEPPPLVVKASEVSSAAFIGDARLPFVDRADALEGLAPLHAGPDGQPWLAGGQAVVVVDGTCLGDGMGGPMAQRAPQPVGTVGVSWHTAAAPAL